MNVFVFDVAWTLKDLSDDDGGAGKPEPTFTPL